MVSCEGKRKTGVREKVGREDAGTTRDGGAALKRRANSGDHFGTSLTSDEGYEGWGGGVKGAGGDRLGDT